MNISALPWLKNHVGGQATRSFNELQISVGLHADHKYHVAHAVKNICMFGLGSYLIEVIQNLIKQ